MQSVPRFDSYSIKRYGETVTVFRLQAGGPFYAEIKGVRKVIRRPNRKKILNARDAQAWAIQKHLEVVKGVPEHPTLAAIFDSYLEHRSPVKATAQGRKDDQRRAEMWKRFLGPTRDPASIERGDLDSFIQKRGYRVIDAWGNTKTNPISISLVVRPRTVHADLQWLRGVLRYAMQDRCPVSAGDIALRKVARELHQSAEPRRPVATQDRFEKVYRALLNDDKLAKLRKTYLPELLVIVNGTGHRLSEILSLQWSDIDLDAKPFGTIRWRADATGNKARLEREIPISPAVRDVLNAIKRKRPGIGEAWLFPGLRNPKHPTHRSVADKWLREAEKAAKLPSQPGSLWHAYRRKWATERKHLPLADVAEAGGWKNARTLQTVYQASDPAGVLRVVLDATELREEKAQ